MSQVIEPFELGLLLPTDAGTLVAVVRASADSRELWFQGANGDISCVEVSLKARKGRRSQIINRIAIRNPRNV